MKLCFPWCTKNKGTDASTASLHAIKRRILPCSFSSLDSQLEPGPATWFGLTLQGASSLSQECQGQDIELQLLSVKHQSEELLLRVFIVTKVWLVKVSIRMFKL